MTKLITKINNEDLKPLYNKIRFRYQLFNQLLDQVDVLLVGKIQRGVLIRTMFDARDQVTIQIVNKIPISEFRINDYFTNR